MLKAKSQLTFGNDTKEYKQLFEALICEAMATLPAGGTRSKVMVGVEALIATVLVNKFGDDPEEIKEGIESYLKQKEDKHQNAAWKPLLETSTKLEAEWKRGTSGGTSKRADWNKHQKHHVSRFRAHDKAIEDSPNSGFNSTLLGTREQLTSVHNIITTKPVGPTLTPTPPTSRRVGRGKSSIRRINSSQTPLKKRIIEKFERHNKESEEMKLAAPNKNLDDFKCIPTEANAAAEIVLRTQLHSLDDCCSGVISVKRATHAIGGGFNLGCSTNTCLHDKKLSSGSGRGIPASTLYNLPGKDGETVKVPGTLIIQYHSMLTNGLDVKKATRILRLQGQTISTAAVNAVSSGIWKMGEVIAEKRLEILRDNLKNRAPAERVRVMGCDGAYSSGNNKAMSCFICAMVLEEKEITIGNDASGNAIIKNKVKGQVIQIVNIQRTKEESAQKMEIKGMKKVMHTCHECYERLVHDACKECGCLIQKAGKDEGRCCWHHGKGNNKDFQKKIVDKKRPVVKVCTINPFDMDQKEIKLCLEKLKEKNVEIEKYPLVTTTIPNHSSATTKTLRNRAWLNNTLQCMKEGEIEMFLNITKEIRDTTNGAPAAVPVIVPLAAADPEVINNTVDNTVPAVVEEVVATENSIVAPVLESDHAAVDWAQCNACKKWRKLKLGQSSEQLPEVWMCSMNTDLLFNKCTIPQEPDDPAPTIDNENAMEEEEDEQQQQQQQQQQINNPGSDSNGNAIPVGVGGGGVDSIDAEELEAEELTDNDPVHNDVNILEEDQQDDGEDNSTVVVELKSITKTKMKKHFNAKTNQSLLQTTTLPVGLIPSTLLVSDEFIESSFMLEYCGGDSGKWTGLIENCKENFTHPTTKLVEYKAAKTWLKELIRYEIEVFGKRIIFAVTGQTPTELQENQDVTVLEFSQELWDSVLNNKEKGGCTLKLAKQLYTMKWVEVLIDGVGVKTEKVYPILSTIRWESKNGVFKGKARTFSQRFNTHFYHCCRSGYTTGQEFLDALRNFRLHMLGHHERCKPVQEGEEANDDCGTCKYAGKTEKVGRQNDAAYASEVNAACDVLDGRLNAKTAKNYLHGDFTTSNECFNKYALTYRPKLIHFKKSELARLLFAAMDWNAQRNHIDSSCLGGIEGETYEQILLFRLGWRNELLEKLMENPCVE